MTRDEWERGVRYTRDGVRLEPQKRKKRNMTDRRLTVAEIRSAVERLIRAGVLANPQNIRSGEPHLVIDVDDHMSDEAIGAGRVRVVLRSRHELRLLAHALDDDDGR